MGRRPNFEEWNDEYLKYGFCLIKKNSLDKNCIVIDVGAHRGWFTDSIIKKFNCFVIAIEPTPNFMIDLRNLQKKYPDKIIIHNKAAWKNNTDEVELYDYNGLPNSLIKRTFCNPNRKANVIKVQTITLDDVISPYNEIDYLKINVEGSEIEIIQGMSDESIKKCKYICVQYHNWLSKMMSKKIEMSDVKKSTERIEKLGFMKIVYDKHPNVFFKRK